MKAFFSLLLIFFAHDMFCQSAPEPCAAEHLHQDINDSWIDDAQQLSAFPSAALHTLPVVFHIIEFNGTGSTSDAAILRSLDDLNNAFANTAYYDQGKGVDTEISFCLAKQDENGMATSGITRTESTLTNVIPEDQDGDLKSLIHWDPNCFINIYIVNEITSASVGTGVRGYANFPSGHGTATDGIVVESDLIGTGEANTSILVHEMGHFLGLYHTFRGGCQNNDCLVDGDRICDTPPDNSTAPAVCDQPTNSCSTDAQSGSPSDLNDPIENYMDYGYEGCKNQFTQGQKDRMKLAIMNMRSSLLSCPTCDDPCLTPISTTIKVDSLYAHLGNPFFLDAESSPMNLNYEWILDGQVVSSVKRWDPQFVDQGKYIFVLRAYTNDGRCEAFDTVCIELLCPIEILHNLTDTFCLEEGSTLTFQASASGLSTPLSWYINDQLVHQGDTYNWQVPATGVFEIYVEGSDGKCVQKSTTYYYYVACREICGNGMDDDGDQLIDGYDPDCCDTVNRFFFDPCYDSCPFEISDAFTSIQAKWRFTGIEEWHDANTPLIGDIDRDGEVEIVGLETDYYSHGQIASKDILVVNGKTGALEGHFLTNEFGPYSRNVSMADTDGDGYAEVYMNHPGLSRYDFTPSGQLVNRWRSTGGGFEQPTLTDFDEDGQVEIYMNNAIYDAQTGRVLVNENNLLSVGSITYPAGNSGGAAVDVLPNDFCPDCSGKELIVGNQVLAVRINRAGVSGLIPQTQSASGADGYTSIADFDLDGDLDAAVLYTTPLPDFKSTRHLYVWDLQTPDLLLPEYTWNNSFNRVAHPAVGDVTGDGKPEICISDYSTIRCLEINGMNWVERFVRTNNDNSGMSGCAMFDFDADGRMEVYHRDERTLRIIEGSTGLELFSAPCNSGTGYDVPTVADIDGDREAELVCSCDKKVVAFEPDPGTWALTRPVWNQLLYYTANINDDLTIPSQQQKHHLPGDYYETNFYLAQYGTKEFQAGDLIPEIVEETCEDDSVRVKIRICNLGPATFNDTLFVSSYSSDPFVQSTSVISIKDTFPGLIEVDSCVDVTITFSRQHSQIFVVVNDNGGASTPFDLELNPPFSSVYECDYLNNMIELSGFSYASPPDLGPDTTMCQFGVTELSPGNRYETYVWQDGSGDSTFTAFEPGTYWVTVTDACGTTYSDTIRIELDDATVIDLGGDLNICRGDTVILAIPGFNSIQWHPEQDIDCFDCPSVRIFPDTTTLVTVLAETKEGCFGFDSVRIVVGERAIVEDSVLICQGDSILLGGTWYGHGEIFRDSTQNMTECDSVITISVFEEMIDLNLGMDFDVCAGDSVAFDLSQFDSILWSPNMNITCMDCPVQSFVPEDTTTIEVTVTTVLGCSYTDRITIHVADTVTLTDSLVICPGDSILVFGEWVKEADIFERTLNSINGCDTLERIVTRKVSPQLDPGGPYKICKGDTVHIQFEFDGEINWSPNQNIDCPDCLIVGFYPDETTTYYATGISEDNCIVEDSLTIVVQEQIIERDTIDICPGDSVMIFGEWQKEESVYFDSPLMECDTARYIVLRYHDIPMVSLPDSILAEEGDLIVLNLQGDTQGIVSWSWQSTLDLSCLDCPSPTVRSFESGLITLTAVTEDGCLIELRTMIVLKKEEHKVYVPNIFSPNGDGLNDVFKVYSNNENAVVRSLQVYDRWGEIVFDLSDTRVLDWEGWDGRFNGELLNPGVVVYRLVLDTGEGETIETSGGVTILW